MVRAGSLSDKWPKMPLGEVVEFLDHLRRPITAADREPGPHPYYGANGQQDSVAGFIFDEPLVLLAEDGGYFGDPTRTIAYRIGGRSWVNNHAHVIKPRPGIDLAFLCRQLEHYDVTPFINGTTRTKLTKGAASEIPLVVPPFLEQRRIAAILDKADAVRCKRKQAIALTDELLRSAFLDLFGDPVTNPKGWEVMEFRDVIASIEAGWSAVGEERQIGPEEMGVLKISAVTSGRFRPEEHKALPRTAVQGEVIRPRRGDLLMSRANTRELVAATCIVEEDCEDLFLPDKLWRLVPREGRATAEYLRYVLAHDEFRSRFTRYATGTSGSMLNISQEKLRETKLPLPPLSLQKQFSSTAWAAFRTRRKQETAEAISTALFNSLSQRAFRGEL